MQRARDELLSRARLARHEHGGLGRRDALDHREHTLHRGALTDHVLEADRHGRALAQTPQLGAQETELDRTSHAQHQLLELERFGQEIVRTCANRSDRGVEIREGRDEDDGHVPAARGELLAQLEARPPAEAHVGHDGVERLRLEAPERVVRGAGARGDVAALREARREQVAHGGVVVDDEDLRCVDCHPPVMTASRLLPQADSLIQREACESSSASGSR